MAKKFRDLARETLSEEEQAEAHAASRAMLLELNLRQIREKVSELSQEDVAQLLGPDHRHDQFHNPPPPLTVTTSLAPCVIGRSFGFTRIAPSPWV